MRNVRHTVGYIIGIVGGLAITAFAVQAYQNQLKYVQDVNQQIHVFYDHQANMEVKSRHDGCDAARCFIATQTVQDVANSQGLASGHTSWMPSSTDLYMTHPLVATVPPAHRRVRITKIIREYYTK